MRIQYLLIAGLLLASAAGVAGNPKSGQPDAAAAFARLKALVGEWEADTKEMGKAHNSYELIANGSVLLERESFAGDKDKTMLSAYHLDGNRLILTHYCMAGNQPRLQLQSFYPASGEMEFVFLDGTNLSSPNTGHMHQVKLRVAGSGSLESNWQFFENGKLKFSEPAQYTRVR